MAKSMKQTVCVIQQCVCDACAKVDCGMHAYRCMHMYAYNHVDTSHLLLKVSRALESRPGNLTITHNLIVVIPSITPRGATSLFLSPPSSSPHHQAQAWVYLPNRRSTATGIPKPKPARTSPPSSQLPYRRPENAPSTRRPNAHITTIPVAHSFPSSSYLSSLKNHLPIARVNFPQSSPPRSAISHAYKSPLTRSFLRGRCRKSRPVMLLLQWSFSARRITRRGIEFRNVKRK